MKRVEVDKTKISPMMGQYLDIKADYEDVILFFRLGDFYEMFFEDAEIASRELEITLTGKNAGLEERIPMCGVPFHSANVYINKLVEKGYKVGICEQVEDPKSAKGIVKREVLQVVSKGTMMIGEFLDEKSNNYIGSVINFTHAYVLSYADISTGEVYTTLIENDYNKIISEIVSTGINEVILTDNVDKKIIDNLRKQYNIVVTVNDKIDVNELYKYIYEDISDERLITGINHLLTYLIVTQKRDLGHLQKVVVKEQYKTLNMDIHTKRNLELTENLRRKERTFSLLWLLDKTKTAMGGRLLRNWIENPITDIVMLKQRQDSIETLLKEFLYKDELKELLNEVYDLERLSGRIAFGTSNARDLLQLKSSLYVLPRICEILKEINFYKKIDTLEDLYELIDNSIYENPPLTLKEGYLIKEGYNKELDELKEARRGGKDFILKIESEEKERTGIKNLKVGFNKVFGYYIEVSKGNVNQIPESANYIRKQTLANCERYITPELKEKEDLILGAEEKIINLEYDLFIKIREKIKEYIFKLQKVSKVLAEIDVLQSLATIAEDNSYVRPTLTLEKTINIKESRHPVVEKVMNSKYVCNDIIMNENTNILLITGPNMAGKSTYMRQMAIIAIMAQIGSYVPAKEAIIPVFDKIFTRIGASDDLVSGESTFMVEMMEANNAISNATENSLILFDELGRGTATYDGMSLAQSIIEYLHDHVKAKTFFSTHYHELTSMDKDFKNLKNIHVSAHEENGEVTFLHKIEDGPVDKSYGIHVAKLAKLPNKIIERASNILKVYENSNNTKNIHEQINFNFEVEEKKSVVEERLEKINPLEITPMDALNLIFELKRDMKENK